jgi:hypothetical protein
MRVEEALRRGVVVSTLGITQTLAWGSTYYLPAVFADLNMMDDMMSGGMGRSNHTWPRYG